MLEQWKQYDANYYVSDQGRVKRVYGNGKVNILKPLPRDKILRVKLYGKYITLNRLVWETFKGKIPEGYTAINKNGFYTMNDIYSLKLVKLSSLKGGRRTRQVIDLKTGVVYPSLRFAEKKLNVSHEWICKICQGYPSEKYKLEYYDENREYSYARRVK